MISSGKAVILIHGLWVNSWSMLYLGRYLASKNFKPYYFKYPSVRSSKQQILALLNKYIDKIPEESLHIVGHSMGGLISLEYLQQENARKIQRCVLLGSPINGSQAADGLFRFKWGKTLLGKNADFLMSNLSFKYPDSMGMIAGTGEKGLGRLFADLEKPHDGAVTVNETKGEGLLHHLTLPVSHSSMLFSRKVAQQVEHFLNTGKFKNEF